MTWIKLTEVRLTSSVRCDVVGPIFVNVDRLDTIQRVYSDGRSLWTSLSFGHVTVVSGDYGTAESNAEIVAETPEEILELAQRTRANGAPWGERRG